MKSTKQNTIGDEYDCNVTEYTDREKNNKMLRIENLQETELI
jgi:hypothetical protein